jgi:sugar/nucleoside kinase (ribokinase family)
LGAVAVDELVYVERFPPPDVKTPVLRSERQCGGLTGTALVAAARLGAACAYAGVLGTDDLSQFALDAMKADGIDVSHVQRRTGARPVHSFIVVDTTAHTRNVFANSHQAVGAGEEWPPAEWIASTRVLLVDHLGIPGMLRAARIAREAGIPIVADFERNPGPGFTALLGWVDHLILSRHFTERLTGIEDPIQAIQRLWNPERSVVIVTGGSEGCWVLAKSRPHSPEHVPAFRVEPVDTTGCGDVFHGAYAAALARNVPLPDRLRIASAAAAIKAMRLGGQAGIPNWNAVETFLTRFEI